MLPGLRRGIERKDAAELDRATRACVRAMRAIEGRLDGIERVLADPRPPKAGGKPRR
jgi:hypothetical protein